MKLKKQFVLERETKGAVRYAELGSDGKVASLEEFAIGTLYLRKKVIGSAIPNRLSVTIEFEFE